VPDEEIIRAHGCPPPETTPTGADDGEGEFDVFQP
jgi:hypothetical protein